MQILWIVHLRGLKHFIYFVFLFWGGVVIGRVRIDIPG